MLKKGLGRGLGALIPFEPLEEKKDSGKGIAEIPIHQISTSRFQPRKNFREDKMEEMVESVKEKGILQPIIVQKAKNGYELVAGERRWRAAQAAGLEKIPAMIMHLSDMETLEVALIENIHRQDLNPIEEANVYHRLGEEFNLTQEEISKRVGKDRSSVANFLRLLKLPPEIKKDIAEERLTMGHARALLPLNPHEQIKLRNSILQKGLSVREVESRIKHIKPGNSKPVKKENDLHLKTIEDGMKKTLGTKVSILQAKKGGKIVINYHSDEEFERILEFFSIK